MNDQRPASNVGALVEVDGLSETFRAVDVRESERVPRLIRCYRHVVSRDRNFSPMIERVIAEFDGHSHEKFIFFREFHSLERSLIISEPFDGVVLSELLQINDEVWHALEPSAALYLAVGVLEAIGDLHELRKFRAERRRRMTPNHIAITATGEVKIIIFPSVTRAVTRRFSWLHDVDAWRRFRAPEDKGDQFHEQSEAIFAVGALLIELLTGERVFERRTPEATAKALAEADISWLRSSLIDISPELYTVLQTAVAVDPSDRFSSADAFAEALREVIAAQGLEIGPDEVIQRLQRSIAGGAVDAPQTVHLTGEFLAVDDAVYSSRGAAAVDSSFAVAEAFPAESTSPDSTEPSNFPGEVIDDRVQTLGRAEQLQRGADARNRASGYDSIDAANRANLHYRTDEYLVLTADPADGETMIELSSDAIRVAARDHYPLSGAHVSATVEQEGRTPSDSTVASIAVEGATVPGEATFSEEDEIHYDEATPEEADAWVSLEEESIVEAEILAEEPMSSPDQVSPPGMPSPQVNTVSEVAENILTEEPDSPLAQAIVLRQNGEFDAAMRLLEPEFFGNSPVVAMLEYAQCTLENGDSEEAEERLTQIVESGFLSDSDQQLARYYLALAFELSPQEILAVRIFRRLDELAEERFPDVRTRIERYERDRSNEG